MVVVLSTGGGGRAAGELQAWFIDDAGLMARFLVRVLGSLEVSLAGSGHRSAVPAVSRGSIGNVTVHRSRGRSLKFSASAASNAPLVRMADDTSHAMTDMRMPVIVRPSNRT
jgi:hypothetical protein